MKDHTRIHHPPEVRLEPWNRPAVAPIYQSAKFCVDSLENWSDRVLQAEAASLGKDESSELYLYSRISNPTTRQLELLLAELQGKEEALVVGSGMAAIATVLLGLLSSGDEVILFRESYAPSRGIARSLLSRMGITHQILAVKDLEGLKRAVSPGKTKIIFFESPTNPMCRVADLDAICKIGRSVGAWTLLDGTFAGIHQHKNSPVDLVIQSLTKFASGHGDLTAGAVLSSRELIQKIKPTAIFLGATLDPHAAFLTQRGMRTYFLRYEAQTQNALKVARYLAGHPDIEKVFYPGLETDSDHALARSQLKDFGSVLSVNLKNQSADDWVRKLKLFSFTVSLGSTDSLATPVKGLYGHDLSPQDLLECEISEKTVRLSIGLEDVEDLISDLDQALASVG